jgi:hypothetical protein
MYKYIFMDKKKKSGQSQRLGTLHSVSYALRPNHMLGLLDIVSMTNHESIYSKSTETFCNKIYLCISHDIPNFCSSLKFIREPVPTRTNSNRHSIMHPRTHRTWPERGPTWKRINIQEHNPKIISFKWVFNPFNDIKLYIVHVRVHCVFASAAFIDRFPSTTATVPIPHCTLSRRRWISCRARTRQGGRESPIGHMLPSGND